MLKTLQRKAHRLAKATRKPQICCLFTLEQPSAVKTESLSELAKFFKKNLQIQAKQKPYRCSDECYPLTDSHQGANHLIQAPKGLWRNDVLNRVRITTLCTDKPIRAISEEISPNGRGKQRICPITRQAIHIRVELVDITPPIRCPPVEPHSR